MKSKNVLLKKAEIKKCIKQLQLWQLNAKETELSRTISFKDHLDALVFIARTTVHAQVLQHHPEIVFSYKKVKIKLTTHELSGLTNADVELAKKIDLVAKVDK
jgi:4a-hydroxytetrahydrobiopterin dehydratase